MMGAPPKSATNTLRGLTHSSDYGREGLAMKATRVLSIPNAMAPSVAERIARHAHLEPLSGCWLWDGSLDRNGYGRFRLSDKGVRRATGAHRAAWLAFNGDIPVDLQIDHLCRSRSCVNPWHMELVTCSVNVQRADHSNKAGRSGRRQSGEPRSCLKHGRSDGYLLEGSDGYVRWVCRPCRRVRTNRARAKKAIAQ